MCTGRGVTHMDTWMRMLSWHLGSSTSFLTPLHSPNSISSTWSHDIPGWHNFPSIVAPAQAAAPSSGSPATHHQAGLGRGVKARLGGRGLHWPPRKVGAVTQCRGSLSSLLEGLRGSFRAMRS